MRKICSFILVICLMAMVLFVNAFAAEAPAEGIVLRVSGETSSGEIVFYDDYEDHAAGWEAAIDLARNSSEMNAKGFKRVVVDFYADWNAGDANGVFGPSGDDGFQYSTIYVPDDVRITLNLNGHTIDRGLLEWEYDGEVMYIDADADVVINDGTITGGWSCNGAGGIHINDDANVVLNNVNVVGNCIEDDDGAGIAVYDGATLTMNGGSVSNNTSYGEYLFVYGGGVYIEDASAFFTKVTFENNQGLGLSTHGAAVYVDDGTLVMDDCQVIGNGWQSATTQNTGACTIIDISNGSNVTMIGTDFLANGYAQEAYISLNTYRYTSVIRNVASSLTMEACTFSDNKQVYLIDAEAAMLTAVNSDFTGNDSYTFYGNCANVLNNTFTNCRFSYNKPTLNLDNTFDFTFYFNTNHANLTFIDCDSGEATFNDARRATFVDSDVNTEYPVGSIFGGDSVAMVLAMAALLISLAALGVTIASNKKKVATTSEREA